MGILDEAIREHLELKRRRGAEESEIEGLEAEAFGPADRPDATGEAETQVISSGPEAKGGQAAKSAPVEPTAKNDPSSAGGGPSSPDAALAGPADAADADATGVDEPGPSPEAATGAATSEESGSPSTEAAATEAPAPTETPPPDEPLDTVGDAGDLLEAERHHLASHPTEHYDVDAAIAEEDEIDLLSESSLSEELDRALEGPIEAEPATPEFGEPPAESTGSSVPPAAGEPTAPAEEPDTDEAEAESSAEEAEGEDSEDDLDDEPSGGGDFFDQEDPLEGTPDFLEETPEHDRLWFEQKEPKDFDFGD